MINRAKSEKSNAFRLIKESEIGEAAASRKQLLKDIKEKKEKKRQ